MKSPDKPQGLSGQKPVYINFNRNSQEKVPEIPKRLKGSFNLTKPESSRGHRKVNSRSQPLNFNNMSRSLS